MEIENGITTFRSQIDNDYIVFIVYNDSDKYEFFRSIFESMEGTVAFLDFDRKLIFIDGEVPGLSVDHVMAIQAHEICHYVLQHDNIQNSVDRMEIEADIASIEILNSMNYLKSADLMRGRLLDRYGIEFTESSIDFILSENKKNIFMKYLANLCK
jgi:hypothetical protein